MKHLLVTSLLLTGLTLGGVTAVHAEGKYQQNSPDQEMTQPRTDTDFSGESSQYTVQEGDTLASIAEEHLGSADQWQIIARANDISNPDQLEVGQKLTIPASSGERSDAGIQNSSMDSSAMQSQADSSAMQDEMNSPDNRSMDQPESDAAAFDETARDFQSDSEQNPADTGPALSEEQEIRGEITEIASGNESLTIKDENGMTHNLKLEDQKVADGVAVGDFVKAEIDGGTVTSLEKVDRNA